MAARAILTGDYNPDDFEVVEPTPKVVTEPERVLRQEETQQTQLALAI